MLQFGTPLHSLSQLFIPFKNLASILSSYANKACVKVREKKRVINHDSPNILCAESLQEVIKNIDPILLEYCSYLVARQRIFDAENSSMLRPVCYSSSSTYFENKYGFPESNLLRTYIQPKSYVAVYSQLYFTLNGLQHSRSFKTRSFKQVTGLRTSSDTRETSLAWTERVPILRGWKTKDKTKSQVEAEQNAKLKTLLSNENLTPEEQQRLRIAFAEGYVAADSKEKTNSKLSMFNIFRDLLGIILILYILSSVMSGSFRKVFMGTANEVYPEEIDVTFEDVKGVDEAKQELQEIVEFLRNPEKFSALGGKLPKGVLLVGPPGTGKTLLARAVAGEADVPFFHAAGPEFDEILVGQGARRVRDLFSRAKSRAPCVIFIDEIDSVGAKRSNSLLHPYANQTINQLLTEMDGFRQNEGVIVLGATNRRDDLDKALLRPGRFDVEINVSVPDLNGRKEILTLYLGKVKMASDVDIEVLARGTTGFTGADLENMVNQAALRAAIDKADSVTMKYLESARDKVLMGPERKSRIPDEEANIITAYHEAGHALVGHYTKDSHPLHKVTIIPRGPSLGHTAYIPEKEHYHVTKSQMLAQMDTLMGGRVAEELIFGSEKITSGAASDLKQATAIATNMVKEWGMSDKVGVRTFEEHQNSLIVVSELSATTTELIDAEIKRLLAESYERAKNILKTHSKEHRLIAEALLKYETLDASDVKELITNNILSRFSKNSEDKA
ncbi:ATP-dependent zinc metalloprotease YME1L-like [Stegodyphus dumicola]|uniref:ATP-dependent zinc metalloprotease YME1L-like n=1 Tax=Stegodyphus dumicola TaxID=202533 RepID=UPI0015AA72A2|nr:ATP-dependent zinc metalloprotease YME1L-like [Stegodyphus dumicola]